MANIRKGDYKRFEGQPKEVSGRVGWCDFYKHRGYLSIGQMKAHACERKLCKFFIPLAHEYWTNKKECE